MTTSHTLCNRNIPWIPLIAGAFLVFTAPGCGDSGGGTTQDGPGDAGVDARSDTGTGGSAGGASGGNAGTAGTGGIAGQGGTGGASGGTAGTAGNSGVGGQAGTGGAAGGTGGAAGGTGTPSCPNNVCEAGETCGNCAQDCGPCAPIFSTPPAPTTLDTQLTCNTPWAQALTSNVEVELTGSDVSSTVGIDHRFGGVGATFELLNNKAPGQGVNILEPRSGAGAGWQTSCLVEDKPGGVGIIVFNQAAGNSTGYQWGYDGTYTTDSQNIFATSWNPVASDHIHATSQMHSPCNSSGYVFDDGALAISGSYVGTAHGKAIAWRNMYRYRSRVQQAWASWKAEQAFYLSRAVARNGGLRLYLKRGAVKHGPLAPYDSFSIPGASCVNSQCNTGAYDYALFVWNIHGQDIGVAIPKPGAVSLNLETTTYCPDSSKDSCGNISFHSWLKTGGKSSFAKDEIRALSQVYYVGTLAQLADLGYSSW